MMGRKHTEEAKAKISATRKASFGVTDDEKRRKAKERYQRWAAANPDRAKEIKRKSSELHRDATNAKQRAENATPERKAYMRSYAAQHRANNPTKYRTYEQNRRSRLLGAEGSHTDAEWFELVQKVGGCFYCGCKGVLLTRDHAVPLVRGGSNDIANIVPACGSCNSAKGTLTAEEFRARRLAEGPSMDPRWRDQLQAARANSPTHRRAT